MVQVGEHEGSKAAIHGAVGVLATVCAVYNVCAWLARRETHLARNAAFYTAIAAIEAKKTREHLHAR